MTKKEFDKTVFNSSMEFIYTGVIYGVAGWSHQEHLIKLRYFDQVDNPFWVRCESVDIIK